MLYHLSYGPLTPAFPRSLCSTVCDGEDEVTSQVIKWLPLEKGQKLTIEVEDD